MAWHKVALDLYRNKAGRADQTQGRSIDLENGYLILTDTKEKKPKLVPLIEDDITLLRTFPKAMPHLYFFRHMKGNGGAKPGAKSAKTTSITGGRRPARTSESRELICTGGHATAPQSPCGNTGLRRKSKGLPCTRRTKPLKDISGLSPTTFEGSTRTRKEKERADKPDGKTIKFPKGPKTTDSGLTNADKGLTKELGGEPKG